MFCRVATPSKKPPILASKRNPAMSATYLCLNVVVKQLLLQKRCILRHFNHIKPTLQEFFVWKYVFLYSYLQLDTENYKEYFCPLFNSSLCNYIKWITLIKCSICMKLNLLNVNISIDSYMHHCARLTSVNEPKIKRNICMQNSDIITLTIQRAVSTKTDT